LGGSFSHEGRGELYPPSKEGVTLSRHASLLGSQ
jgi:hypothetical protein